jgi:TM2 domain-containing membrane protein YozV
MQEMMLMQQMNDQQKMMFMSEMNKNRKDSATAVLLAFFLGGFGAHHFYMGNTGIGILYVLLFWTFIPAIIAFIECFLMSSRVRLYNDTKAIEIAQKIKMIS